MNEIEVYINRIDDDKKADFIELFDLVRDNLPFEYVLNVSYGMICFSVPFSRYKKGYHAKENTELPFIYLGVQKHYIAMYHLGVYNDKEVHDWYVNEYEKRYDRKVDMGKSCIRFKHEIPYDLILELLNKISIDDYIDNYDLMRRD